MNHFLRRLLLVVAIFTTTALVVRPQRGYFGGPHFAAPHKDGADAFISRLLLGAKVPHFAGTLLDAIAPQTAYACLLKPCTGTAEKVKGVCVNVGGFQCTSRECVEVQGNHRCQSAPFNCRIPGGGTYPCTDALNKACSGS